MGEPVDFRTPEEIKRDQAKAKYETAKFKSMEKGLPEENKNRELKLKNENIALEATAKMMGLEVDKLFEKMRYISDTIKANTHPEPPVGQGRGKVTVVTNVKRNLVLRMAAGDENHNDICKAIGLSKNKLYELYREDLDLGKELHSCIVLSGFSLAAWQGMSNPKYAKLFQLMVTNKTDITEKQSVDVTNSDGSMMPVLFVRSNGREKQIDRNEMLKQIAIKRGDVVEGEVISNG